MTSDYAYNGGFVPNPCGGPVPEVVSDPSAEIGPEDVPAPTGPAGDIAPGADPVAAFGSRSRSVSVRSSRSVFTSSRSVFASSQPLWPDIVQEDADLLPPAIAELDRPPVPARPLTVAHVGPYFLRGGAEQWLIDLIANADPRRLRFVRCVATECGTLDLDYVDALARHGVTLEAGGSDSVRQAARDADVLISWGVELDDLLGVGTPDAVRPRLSVHVVHGEGAWGRHFLTRSRRSIDHAVAVSRAVRDRSCGDVPATVIYNGVDAARLAPRNPAERTRRALGFVDGDFVVGFVGRFAREKRPAAVIDAVARLPERFKVLLVGWGRLLPELRDQAARLLPGRHVITHASEGLGDLYRAMDTVCLVSGQEGFPLAMLEAMLCGRPLVSTPVGCVPEVIEDRVNGLWTTGAPDDLAAALARLASHPRWARGLAEEGFALAERFGYARRMARDYEHLLHDLWTHKHVDEVESSNHAYPVHESNGRAPAAVMEAVRP